MTELTNRISLRARYVIPIVSPPIKDAVIHIVNGKIASLEPWQSQPDLIDLGDVALLPPLVNSHTHLEFSSLTQPLGESGVDTSLPFTDWIGHVLEYRIQRDANSDGLANALRAGLQKSLNECVGIVGEIATAMNGDPYVQEARTERSVMGVQFLELIGGSAERVADQLVNARRHVQLSNADSGWCPGLSPHAPYTASLELVEGCVQIARSSSETSAWLPIAMHLAETKEEIEFLATNRGPFRDLLEQRGVWNQDVWTTGMAPIDYLRVLAKGDRSLVIHGNYLSAAELDFLAEHRSKMSVVYCPRTHAYFGHERYPLSDMLRKGISVALGTDSLASNPDLGVWNEMRFIADHYPEINPVNILKMGTINGATALGLPYGIRIGSSANLIQVSVDPTAIDDPYARLFSNAEPKISWLNV